MFEKFTSILLVGPKFVHQSVYMARVKSLILSPSHPHSCPDLGRQGKERRFLGRDNQKLLLISSGRVIAWILTQWWSQLSTELQRNMDGNGSSYKCSGSVLTSPAHPFHF